MKVMIVAGTRPEFIRLSLVLKRFADLELGHVLIHTGQNYDPRLSDVFFEDLGLPEPDEYLNVRAETAGQQIGHIVARSEDALRRHGPDALMVLGDTNSGLSAIAAARLNIPIFHMEAGNRCFDWRVPEEKNRRLIDHISDWLLPYTSRSREYLLAEGVHPEKIFVSGNPIVDVLEGFRHLREASSALLDCRVRSNEYVLLTVHREETVDFPERLQVICGGLNLVAQHLDMPVVWSVHPRTRPKLAALDVVLDRRIQLHEPFGFGDFVALEAGARCVVTDSGTVQEECSLLGVPAVTCRDTTERPETVECGSNILSGVSDPERLALCVDVMVSADRNWRSPYANDKGVAERVTQFVVSNLR
ncbi:MAG TPA: UDP-N-acetylglucosamine 2-epimerase (non-hydrolyzing) [Solirubrobacteraceae bacterium]|jgi:UDP-N-acetylglucosamine 2-epimerase (non-hydrolysing)|nr:UDP-N-acetylglucosamine 2-epimerase (non-hydrolyzing) [Solirubrobacteraceae bacterium]